MAHQKFDNFKLFVESEVPGSAVSFLLRPLTLHAFIAILIKMKEHYQGELTAHNVAAAILDHLNIDPSKFTPEARTKFELYCEYFLQVVNNAA